jgi:hypothetical protein
MPHTFCTQVLVPSLALIATACSGGGGGPAPLTPTLAFGAPQLVNTGGGNGRDLVVADMDHDGIADAVVANETFASVSVLRGLATGALLPGVLVPAPALVACIAVADVDGDRILDLVAASGASTQASVARGIGDGTFQAASALTMPWACRKVALIDWNGDGHVDLLAASAQTAEIALLPGDGVGGFGAAQIASTLFAVADFVLAEVNGDQLPDLIYTGLGVTSLGTLRNDGIGGFLPVVESSVEAQGGKLVAANLDGAAGDLIPDLVTLNAARTKVLAYRGNGAGLFAKVSEREIAGATLNSLALGDIDGDGKVDFVAGAGNLLLVGYGNGVGGFGAAETLYTDGLGASWVAVSDLVGDGTSDVLYVSGSNRLGTLRNPRLAPNGLASYGQGTPDCAGRIGMWANGSPRIGNADYGYLVTNAPPEAIGVVLQGGPADVAGSDPFGIGLRLHIGFDLVTSKLVFSDSLGTSFLPEPVPAEASLVGLPVFVQTLWQADLSRTCSSSPAGLVSSAGLTSTIQP